MKKYLENALETEILGKNIIYYDEVSSTNIVAKDLMRKGVAQGTIIIANYQTEGKGRQGKNWVETKGEGIAFSIILYPNYNIEKISILTLITGIVVCQSLREITGYPLKIKWPNDIILNGKKICGILTEAINIEDGYGVVVGIGINVNNVQFAQETPYASSLYLECLRRFNRADIISVILKKLETSYKIYQTHKNFVNFIDIYEELCLNIGEAIYIKQNGAKVKAYVLGVTKDGNLSVQYDKGHVGEISSGEVSIRGIYGYS
ncbi:MAG: biotin--[acetyl-CoA-carboxylase] ligase [Epulopiscium sp. Nele67-Bin005]|nr:MAG: biotin--[acetyl-CoA-carboxylase] ligase [Epulopiscium sp. Nele67-Bin005]